MPDPFSPGAGTGEPILAAVSRLIAEAGGIVILAMMFVAVLDVVLRYLYNAPLSSSYELIQLGMVLVVYCGLAWCGLTGGHIAVNFVGALLDRPRLRWLNALVHGAGAILFLVIAWRSAGEALKYFASGETTNMLKAPLYPFLAAVAAGALLYAVTLGWQCVRALRAAGGSGSGLG